MAKGYRTKLEGILKQVRPRLVSTHNLEFKNCFGAVAGYVDGQIFCSCGQFGLALRLPELFFNCAWRSSVAVNG